MGLHHRFVATLISNGCWMKISRSNFQQKNLFHQLNFSQIPIVGQKSNVTPLLKQLIAKIKFSGPLTVYDYMKEVLINPSSGYYMKKNVMGAEGDFTTSPEISQMFGEMVGIWLYNEWHKLGSPKPLQIVEFGPGSGKLLADILKVWNQFAKNEKLNVHMIEVSPFLSRMQEEKLCGKITEDESTNCEQSYKSRISMCGTPVHWHRHFSSVPQQFSLIVAHEFFDALPVHRLINTNSGWREILVDVDTSDGPHHLRFVISRSATPASQLYPQESENRMEIEVCPDVVSLGRQLTHHMRQNGGVALVMDYGHDGTKESTFRAFQKHQLHDPLCEPGLADLTADVDFSFLRQNVDLFTFGPVDQAFFLKNMGIDFRLMKLLTRSSSENQRNLILNYKMLTDGDQMGKRFKFFSMYPKAAKDLLHSSPPAGFSV